MTIRFFIVYWLLPVAYWVGICSLILSIFLGVLYVIVKLFTKKNFRLFLRYLVFPRPVLTYSILKTVAIFIDDETLSALLRLRQVMDNRFGNFLNAPLILNLGEIKAASGNNVILNHSGVSWYVSNKIACVNIPINNIEEVLCLLVDILPGRTFDVINVPLNLKDIKENTPQVLNDTLNLVEKISNIKCNIFVTVDIANFHLPIHDITIGFTLSGISRGYITRDFDTFLELFMNQLMLDTQNIVSSVDQILQLYEHKTALVEFLSGLGGLNEKISGMYFIGNKPLQNEKLYWNNLAELTLFNYTNNSVLLKTDSYARRNSIINKIFFVTSLLSIAYILFYIPKQKRFITNFYRTLEQIPSIDKKNNIANTNILNDLQVEKLGVANKLLNSKYLDMLNNIRNTLANGTKNIHNDLQKIIKKNIDESITNPMNSNSFTKLKNYVNTTEETVRKLYKFHIDTYGKPSNSLMENLNKIKGTLVNQFVLFFTGLNNNKFSRLIKSIKQVLNRLLKDQNANKDDIYHLRNLFSDLKSLLENSAEYQWWVKKNNLGYNYDTLLWQIKSIPLIGHDLFETITSKENQIIYNIRYNNLEAEHVLTGAMLQSTNESIVFSPKLNNFLAMLDWCLMQSIIQLSSPKIQVPTIKKHQYYMWNCDKLDNIIYYINTREKFLEDIKPYDNLTKNLLQKIADNTLKSFIDSQLILSAYADSNDLSLELKVTNLQQGHSKLKQIEDLCKIYLRHPIHNVFLIAKDNVHKLVKSIETEFDRTIYTSYSNLQNWDGSESIIRFLFGINESEFGVVLTNGLNDLKNMYTNYSEPILDLLREYANSSYKNMKYIGEQLKMYENNKKNDISLLEDFLTNLTDWKIKWIPVAKPTFVKNFFFKKHLEHFKRNVYMSTNKLCLEKSIAYYNEIADLFHEKIKDKFPFGSGYEVDSQHLADFLVLYQKYRNHLLQDKGFLAIVSESIQMKQVMENLESLNKFFIVNYPHVKYKIKIQYDTEDGDRKHTNILYQIRTKCTTNAEFKNDTVDYETNAEDHMGISIPIADGSSMVFSPEAKDVTYHPLTLRVYYATPYGYIRFINRFQVSKKERYRVLRFKFPLMKKEDKKKHIISSLEFWGRVFNVPDFIFHMPKINIKK